MVDAAATPTARKGLLRSLLYPLLRPIYFPARHYYKLFRLRTAGINITRVQPISMGSPHQERVERMKAALPPRVRWKRIALDSRPLRDNLNLYFQQHREV